MLLTPECLFCGKKFLRRTAWDSPVRYIDSMPAISTRWPSISIHHECAKEFVDMLYGEFGVDSVPDLLIEEFGYAPGRDANYSNSVHNHESLVWRWIKEET